MEKTGVLLINLGTPESAAPKSVRRFLREFLNDPRVINIPTFFRWFLVNFLILPFRTQKSAHAYQKIWMASGSPLLFNSINMKDALVQELPAHYQVELGMRYGNPNIKTALEALKSCQKLIVLPLFPQYSNAATGSALAVVQESLAQIPNASNIYIQKDFYNHLGFIKAFADIIRNHIQDKPIDRLIFSYHGLPERQLPRVHCTSCDKVKPCVTGSTETLHCYRAQCYKTSQLIAEELRLSTDYLVAFQSRLGRIPWIKPYTDQILPELIQQGVKNIAIVCPSFVADCLETLEEINIRARAQWKSLGGEEFIFIPCLNSHPVWINTLLEMVGVAEAERIVNEGQFLNH